MTEIIIACAQVILLVVLAPLVSGSSRWLRAKMHTRQGPPILQDYYDIIKLFKRQDLHTRESGFVHRLMPPLFFGTMLLLALGLPMVVRFSPLPFLADIILIVYLLALPRFFFALSAIDSGSSYAGVGGIHELMIGILVEPAMMLALFVAALSAGSTNVGVIGETVGSLAASHPTTVIIAGLAFALACYIELAKLPYDLAEAEQELQEGPLAEYSGPSLAIAKMAMSMKQIVVVSWFLAMFLPFGAAAEVTALSLVIGLVAYLLKLAAVFFICAIFENVVSRVRFKLLGRQTWAVFGISVFAFVFWILGV